MIENTELMHVKTNEITIGTSGTSEIVYSSIVPRTAKEKKDLYNAVNGDVKHLSDMINCDITVKDIIVQKVDRMDENTGIIDAMPRIVLVATDGTPYVASSKGIFNSVKTIMNIFGEPADWDEPITVTVKQILKGEFRILTLAIK